MDPITIGINMSKDDIEKFEKEYKKVVEGYRGESVMYENFDMAEDKVKYLEDIIKGLEKD